MLRRTLLFALVFGIAFSLSGGAQAHVKRFKTRVTNSAPEPFHYEGRVFSRLDACVRRRPLVMWRDEPGPDDTKIQAFQAKADGRWEFGFIGKEYYVVAKRVVKGSGAHRHICLKDRSPTV
jgi:hypothetical protein